MFIYYTMSYTITQEPIILNADKVIEPLINSHVISETNIYYYYDTLTEDDINLLKEHDIY
jgi:hypothetical protein